MFQSPKQIYPQLLSPERASQGKKETQIDKSITGSTGSHFTRLEPQSNQSQPKTNGAQVHSTVAWYYWHLHFAGKFCSDFLFYIPAPVYWCHAKLFSFEQLWSHSTSDLTFDFNFDFDFDFWPYFTKNICKWKEYWNIIKHNFSVITIQETWFTEHTCLELCDLPDYIA